MAIQNHKEKLPNTTSPNIKKESLIEEFVKISPEVWQIQKEWLRTALTKIYHQGKIDAEKVEEKVSPDVEKVINKLKKSIHSRDCEDGLCDCIELIIQLRSALTQSEARGYRKAIEDAIACLPEEIDCEEADAVMPTDAGLAADQAVNHFIRKIKNNLSKLLDNPESLSN